MDISVSGKNIDVGEAFRGYAADELAGAVSKYFDKALDANVVVSREGASMHVDITVHPGPRGIVVQGNGTAEEAYPAFDGALERISKQLRRYKRRLVDDQRRRVVAEDVLAAQQYVIRHDEDEDAAVDDQPVIVAEMQTDIATISVSEAVMRMNLANAPVLMFRNSQTNALSVVYHRRDGNIGWIDPSAGDPGN